MPRKLILHPFPHQQGPLSRLIAGAIWLLCVVAGRGAGKTETALLAVIAFTRKFLKAGGIYEIWWVTSTITGQGRKPWRFLKKIFGPLGWFTEYTIRINEQGNIIEIGDPSLTKDVVSIRIRAAKGRESTELEGDAIHFLVIDEAGTKYVTKDIYNSLMPAVTRVNGRMFIMGTPPIAWLECVKGWFREVWDLADSGEVEGWEAARWNTFENPVYGGGGMLPEAMSVFKLAQLSEKEVRDYITERKKFTQGGKKAFYQMRQDIRERALYVLTKGDKTPAVCIKVIEDAAGKQVKTLEHIAKHLRKGNADEAEREYEGHWLPRPSSMAEDDLTAISVQIRPGERFMMGEEGEFEEAPVGSLEIWEYPEDEDTYVVSADTGGGAGGDYSVAAVIRRPRVDEKDKTRPAMLAAMFRSNTIPADAFGKRVYYLAMYYNHGLVVVERTGAWGVTALVAMRDCAIKQETGIWLFDESCKDAQLVSSDDARVDRMGWETRPASEGMMLSTLRRYIHARQVILPSETLYDEICEFDWDKREGPTDDTVMALSMGLQAMDWVPVEAMEKKSFDEQYTEDLMALVPDEVSTW